MLRSLVIDVAAVLLLSVVVVVVVPSDDCEEGEEIVAACNLEDVVRRSSRATLLYSIAPRKNARCSGMRLKALLFSDFLPTQTLMLASSSSGKYRFERSACASV